MQLVSAGIHWRGKISRGGQGGGAAVGFLEVDGWGFRNKFDFNEK